MVHYYCAASDNNREKRLLSLLCLSVCLSVCLCVSVCLFVCTSAPPYGTTQIQLDGFSWNFVFRVLWKFAYIFQKIKGTFNKYVYFKIWPLGSFLIEKVLPFTWSEAEDRVLIIQIVFCLLGTSRDWRNSWALSFAMIHYSRRDVYV
jgi:hypothetical protein